MRKASKIEKILVLSTSMMIIMLASIGLEKAVRQEMVFEIVFSVIGIILGFAFILIEFIENSKLKENEGFIKEGSEN